MKRKTAALISVVLTLCLTGCGNGTTSSTEESSVTETTTSEVTSSSEETSSVDESSSSEESSSEESSSEESSSEDSSSSVHVHTLTHCEANAATCEEEGNIEYWYCTECGKYFSDEGATIEITDITVPAKGHSLSHHDAVSASCTEAGTVEYWSCDECGKYFSDEEGKTEITNIVEPAKGHTLTKHEAVEATCTEDGTVEYWSCSDCEKNFSDADGNTELESIVDPAKGHKLTHHDAISASCTEEGTVEYWSCSECGKYFSDSEGTAELESIIDPAKGHNMTHHEAVTPTCTEDGTVEYWSCSDCEKNFSDENGKTELTSIVDPATGHSMTHHDAVSASCTESGTVEYWSCSGCNKNFADAEGTAELTSIVTSETGHSLTHYAAADATCEKDGNTEYWYCSVCEKYFSDEACSNEIDLSSTVIAATDHDWDTENILWTFSEDFTTATATFTCRNDKDHAETVDAFLVTTDSSTDPTCEEKGSTTYKACCLFNNAVYTGTTTVYTDALGHSYDTSNIVWNWAEDCSSATATFTCSVDGHQETVYATTIETLSSTEADCTTDGSAQYQATVTFQGETYTDTETVTYAATGHDLDSDYICTECGYEAGLEFTVNSDNESYSVSGYGNYFDTFADGNGQVDLVIPSTYKGYPVTAISNSAFSFSLSSKKAYREVIKSVTIPDSITSVGAKAFAYNQALTEVTVPGSVTEFKISSNMGQTFHYCTALKKAVIEDGAGAALNSASYMFQLCSALEEVTLPDDGGFTSIPASMFSNCSSLKSIDIPESVTEIQPSAFSSTGFEQISLPSSLKSIGGTAFNNCTGLTSVVLPESLDSIGTRAFNGCTNLTTVVIPKNVSSANTTPFKNCTSLAYICLGAGSEEEVAFDLTAITGDTTVTGDIYYYSEAQPASGSYWHYDEEGNVVIWEITEA